MQPKCLLMVLSMAGLAGLFWAPFRVEPMGKPPAEEVPFRILPSSPARTLQEILAEPDRIPSHHHPLLGKKSPEFALRDHEGKTWNLKELIATGPVVAIFYYGYHCDHCVQQLFDVDKELSLFHALHTTVVAISPDPPEMTRKRLKQYGHFGFPLLTDPQDTVAKAFGVPKPRQNSADLRRHGTFLIDREGTVRWINVGDAPFRRNSALFCQLAQIQGQAPYLSLVSANPSR